MAAKTGVKYISFDEVATPAKVTAVSLANLNIPLVEAPNKTL